MSGPKKPRKFIRTRAFTIALTGDLQIDLGIRVKGPNSGRTHWGSIRTQRTKVAKLVATVDRPLAARTITFTRWAPSSGLDGDDNLNMAMKPIRDQVVAWLQGLTSGNIAADIKAKPDDGPGCGLDFRYEQHRHDAYGVRVTIR